MSNWIRHRVKQVTAESTNSRGILFINYSEHIGVSTAMQHCRSVKTIRLFIKRNTDTAVAWFSFWTPHALGVTKLQPCLAFKQFSVEWSFDHIFCCLLCTLIWHKQRNHRHTRAHIYTYGWSQLYCTTLTDSLAHTSLQTFTNEFNSTRQDTTNTHTYMHMWISCYFNIHWVWVTRDW